MDRRTSGVMMAAALALLALPALAQERGRLTIHVEGVKPGGILRLGVYDRKGYDSDGEPVAAADVPARPGVTTVILDGIAAGDYAVMTYQDLNSNDKTDSNFLGVPKEPYGFSRNARPFLSKPGFNDTRFTVTAGENTQTLRLQNTGK